MRCGSADTRCGRHDAWDTAFADTTATASTETCDDGDGVGCDELCEGVDDENYTCGYVGCHVRNTCGHGHADTDEACDDGNESDGDGCGCGSLQSTLVLALALALVGVSWRRRRGVMTAR